MITLLLASVLTCADGYWFLDGLNNANISNKVKAEIRIEILNSMPDNCNRDDYELRS